LTESLENLGVAFRYSSAESDLISAFYVPCLEVAERYDRAVGFFRSSVYNLVGVALSDFVLRGGTIRLICSPGLVDEDRLALERDSLEERASGELLREVERVLRHPENLPVVELLATLLCSGALEVKVAYKPNEAGIFHDKVGLFHSPVDSLSFTGSSNETYLAWDPDCNHEGFDTFGSWESSDRRRVVRHIEYFEALWASRLPGLVVAPFPQVPREVLERHANDAGVEVAIERARAHLRRVERSAGRRRRVLQDHQKDVVDNWLIESRGIIDHVTGAGKTVSALEVLRRWLGPDKARAAIVFVPSDLLSQQWDREIRMELQDLNPRILHVGGALSLPSWRSNLTSFTASSRLGPRITIATIQSGSSSDFLDRVQGDSHLLVVADEVHRVGSSDRRRILRLPAGGRLGLSATPERFGDPEGTAKLLEYYGPILKPPFGIPEAQAAGRLVPYDYFVHTADLTEDEDSEYERLSQRLRQLCARTEKDGSDAGQQIQMLQIARARIVKKARQKLPLTASILQQEYRDGQRWLVYCEDTLQLDEVIALLRTHDIETLEYHSAMVGDPPATLRSFESYGGVLVSIRCLDEGVDIPAVDHALVLASATNPREYIQRRGRVLRTAVNKYSAEIHDVLVCRVRDGRPIVLNRDLERARQFAVYARNEACRYRLDELQSEMTDRNDEFEEDGDDVEW
jgi:superfamily II DNA or RNA helicase